MHTKLNAAVPDPTTPKGHAINIYFDVTDQENFTTGAGVPYQYYSDDDRLFHELVHASRMTRLGFNGVNYTPMSDYRDVDEFLAVHMQNVYLGQRGNPRFYLNSGRGAFVNQPVSKGAAYSSFASDREVLATFRSLVETESLARTVASWTQPASSFNPWRDLPNLLAMGRAP